MMTGALRGAGGRGWWMGLCVLWRKPARGKEDVNENENDMHEQPHLSSVSYRVRLPDLFVGQGKAREKRTVAGTQWGIEFSSTGHWTGRQVWKTGALGKVSGFHGETILFLRASHPHYTQPTRALRGSLAPRCRQPVAVCRDRTTSVSAGCSSGVGSECLMWQPRWYAMRACWASFGLHLGSGIFLFLMGGRTVVPSNFFLLTG